MTHSLSLNIHDRTLVPVARHMWRKNIFAGVFEERANLCILSTSDTVKSLWIPAVALVLFSIRGG